MAGTIVASTINNDTGLFSTNNAYLGIAKAWVSFNGSGSATVNNSFNISSVTRVATGQYTINFTTAMPNANYSAAGMAQLDATNTSNNFMIVCYARTTTAPSTTSFQISTVVNGGGWTDAPIVNVSVFSS